MKISFGSIIEIDDTDEELNRALDLKCKCGHKLRQHSWTTAYWYPDPQHHTLYANICVSCSIKDCPGFKADQ